MRNHLPLRRPLTLALAFVLAPVLVPLDASPAEAKGIKFRTKSSSGPSRVSRPGDDTHERGRSSFSFRIPGSRGSGEDERASARDKPQGSAAAAAERARAALEGEKASRGAAPAVHQPVPIGETKSYSNGVMCVAGC
jgi:hypothetical protein